MRSKAIKRNAVNILLLLFLIVSCAGCPFAYHGAVAKKRSSVLHVDSSGVALFERNATEAELTVYGDGMHHNSTVNDLFNKRGLLLPVMKLDANFELIYDDKNTQLMYERLNKLINLAPLTATESIFPKLKMAIDKQVEEYRRQSIERRKKFIQAYNDSSWDMITNGNELSAKSKKALIVAQVFRYGYITSLFGKCINNFVKDSAQNITYVIEPSSQVIDIHIFVKSNFVDGEGTLLVTLQEWLNAKQVTESKSIFHVEDDVRRVKVAFNRRNILIFDEYEQSMNYFSCFLQSYNIVSIINTASFDAIHDVGDMFQPQISSVAKTDYYCGRIRAQYPYGVIPYGDNDRECERYFLDFQEAQIPAYMLTEVDMYNKRQDKLLKINIDFIAEYFKSLDKSAIKSKTL